MKLHWTHAVVTTVPLHAVRDPTLGSLFVHCRSWSIRLWRCAENWALSRPQSAWVGSRGDVGVNAHAPPVDQATRAHRAISTQASLFRFNDIPNILLAATNAFGPGGWRKAGHRP